MAPWGSPLTKRVPGQPGIAGNRATAEQLVTGNSPMNHKKYQAKELANSGDMTEENAVSILNEGKIRESIG